jgi:hypothetical protein
MQPLKPRNNKEKPKYRKPSKISGEQTRTQYPDDNRRRGGPTQFVQRNQDPPVHSAKPPLQTATVQIYKQDLLQKGFEVFHSKRNQEKAIQVSEKHPECFNVNKRKVICEAYDKGSLEQIDISTSRINLREELKEDFGHLLDNEDIPDWFVEGAQADTSKLSFDFGSTVDKTKQFYAKKATGQVSLSAQMPPAVQLNPEMNFDELDKLLEKKYKESRTGLFIELEGEELLLDKNTGEVEHPKQLDPDEGEVAKTEVRMEELGYSMNDSGDYFNDLHGNLKKAILKYGQFSSGDEKESDESFQESLGFEAKRDGRTHKPDVQGTTPAPALAPVPAPPTNDQLQHFRSLIHPVDSNTPIANTISFNMTLCDDLPPSVIEANAFREAVEKDEVLKLSDSEKVQRQQLFLAKYGYLDPIMCQLCYEILVSKSRQTINELSTNGFNQKSVERYCANKYKIFSLFLQGDIISKVWFYRDKNGIVLGPFMSFDMDIWNAEKEFFHPEVMIALDRSPFLSIQFWVHRSSIVLKIVDKFTCMIEERKKIAPPVGKKWRHSGEQRRYDKRVTFNKKAETESVQGPTQTVNQDSLIQNYSELFPAIEETQTNEKKSRKQSESGDTHLLDTLRASISNAQDIVGEKKEVNQTTQLPSQQKTTKTGNSANLGGPDKEQSEKFEKERKKEGHTKGKKEVSKRQEYANDKIEIKKQTKGPKAQNPQKEQTNQGVTDQHVFVKQEIKHPEPDPSSNLKKSLDKQKTENIKQMLGLNF